MMNEIDQLRKTVEKQRKLLNDFGYPERKPIPQADPVYWKNKYKALMEEKIALERLYGDLWTVAKSVVTQNNIPKGKHKNIQGPTGEFLFEGEGEVSDIVKTYKKFGHEF